MRPTKKGLTIVERAYLRSLKPELKKALADGAPERAATFAKVVARLIRKAKRGQTDGH
jgi:hypothetical protein